MAFTILDMLDKVHPDKLNSLCATLCDTFDKAMRARSGQEKKHRDWENNYLAKPKEEIKTFPFYKASNFVPQLIRMHTDILAARIIGLMFGTKPFWRTKIFGSVANGTDLLLLNSWMDRKCFGEIQFFDPIDTMIFSTVKTGTQVLKNSWLNEKKSLGKPTEGGKGFEFTEFDMSRVSLDPIPFDDFYPFPVTARNLTKCTHKFHKLRFTRDQVLQKKATGWWNGDAVDLLLAGPSSNTETGATQIAAQASGIALQPDTSFPYQVIEVWFDWNELENGRSVSMVAVFNPAIKGNKGLLKLYFNFYSRPDLDGFTDFRIMPNENSFWGDCVPNVLEQSQEEQAQIHNSRRDANKIANVPGWKKKILASGINPSTEWYPGKVFEVEDMGDLEPLVIQANYNSLIEEEQALMQIAERYTGISPAMQGFGAGSMQGRKGIYANSATLALLSEGNRRLDIYLKRLRMPMHRVGRHIFTSYRDFKGFSSEMKAYKDKDVAAILSAFKLIEPPDYMGAFFEMGASDASANKETDRTSLLLMANTMASYYTQVTQYAQLALQAQGPLQQLALQIVEGAKDLAERLLFVFDVEGSSRLVPDLQKILRGEPVDDRPAALEQSGMPGPEEPVSESNLRDVAARLSAISGSVRQQAGGPSMQSGGADSFAGAPI